MSMRAVSSLFFSALSLGMIYSWDLRGFVPQSPIWLAALASASGSLFVLDTCRALRFWS